jgi:hypothetical protein
MNIVESECWGDYWSLIDATWDSDRNERLELQNFAGNRIAAGRKNNES